MKYMYRDIEGENLSIAGAPYLIVLQNIKGDSRITAL
jgi:hypothetical protein